MDLLTIIFIVAAALIGAAITYFVTKRKGDTPPSSNEDLQKVKETFIQREEALKKELEQAKDKVEGLSKQLTLLQSGGEASPELLSQLADIEKFKKKIKQLEGELEDMEDDLDDEKKRRKKKDEEYLLLEDAKLKQEKDLRKKEEELSALKDELQAKSEELNLKMESLAFVQSILSAPEFSDSDTNSLYSKVDVLKNFIQGEFRDTLKSIWSDIDEDEETARLFNEDLNRWEAIQKKSWIANKVAIAFVGEFSAGKTSIVNRILSQDDPNVPLLPVSTKATTAIPTYISGGIKTDYKFFTQDNKLKKIAADDFNRVTKEVLDQVGGVSNLIQYFVMTYRNDNLNNLSILDTPGFSSNDKEDSERTLEVINECDALFWVFDVNAGTVNKSSIDLIKHNLKKPLYVVINKVDTKADSEVDEVERLIRETFQHEGIAVRGFIRFSSKASLATIMNPVKSISSTTQGENYLSKIKELIGGAIKDKEEEFKDKNKQYNECKRLFEDARMKFDESYSTLMENCDYAVKILEESWTEQGFSKLWGNKDKYELSKDEGEALKKTIVDYIADNNMTIIKRDHETIVNINNSLTQSYSDYLDCKEQLQEVQRLSQRLNKNVNALK